MFKSGIYSLEQVRENLRFSGILGGKKKLSITLYDQIKGEPNVDELAERILLLFSDERGAYKRTYARRFEDFDKVALDYLQRTFTVNIFLQIHDVAVSDGRTALDFFESVSSFFENVEYTASDYNPIIYVIESGKFKITLSQTGQVLEIVAPPFVFNESKRDRWLWYPLNRIIRLFVREVIVPGILKRYEAGSCNRSELKLFAPRVVDKSIIDPRFILRQYDVLKHFDKQYNIIRAMNILNPTYFSEGEFLSIINHIYSGLKDGGVFITGSNEGVDSIVHGGIYIKAKNGFVNVFQSGNGSLVNDLILSYAI